jgi:hypothetical protein
MVFLAITPDGLSKAMQMAATTGTSVWCGADAISELDYANLKPRGLSRFNYQLGSLDADSMADALQTIGEHHPGETVWVESVTARPTPS